MGKYGSDEQIKFFYKNKFLGSCDPDYFECDKLYELIKSDSRAATQVLNYMNSLGDPVFPTEDGGYDAETDVSKVDIDELYATFMQELEYYYQDSMSMGFGFLVDSDAPGGWDFEIFDGPTVDDIESSTKIKASRYDNVPGYKAPKGGYLYIFKHGVGPGTIPSDVKVIKWKDLPNYYTAVWLDRWLDSDELKEFDIPSETEINRYLDRIGYCQKDGDVVPCDDVEACDDIKATTDTSSMVNTIYSVMMNYEYGYDPDMTDIDSMLQELTNKGVHVDTSNAFKKAWVSAHNKAERKTWGGSGDSMRYDDLTPRELDAIENYDTEYWEYVKDHPLNLKPASSTDITSSTDTKYFANMVSASSYDSPYDENDELYKYSAQGFLQKNLVGLMEEYFTNDFDELLTQAAEMSSGLYIELTNQITGKSVVITPEDWDEASEYGEYPQSVYSIV